jgi:hypothetical protein
MSATTPHKKTERAFREMTAAHIREDKGAEFVEVVFLESARFYKLPRKNRKFEEILRELREAIEQKRTVRVLVDFPYGDVIEDVQAGE